MALEHILFFAVSFFIVLKGADYAIRYATRLATLFNISDFLISFFVVAVISALPEAVISIIAHTNGDQSLALTAILGSNVTDLTLVFGFLAFVSRGVKVESKIMRKDVFYLILLVLPLLLGIDGTIGRAEGAVLIMSGLLFFYTLSIEQALFEHRDHHRRGHHIARAFILLAISVIVMGVAANFTIDFLRITAADINIPAIVIAVVVVGVGVCLPELIFSYRAIKTDHDGLALGDILGTVIIDGTIILGVMALIAPIQVDLTLMRVLTLFNAIAACCLIYFVKTKKILSRVEGIFLLVIYATFLAVMFTQTL